MPAEDAAALHAQLLAYLVQKGLFVWLAAIVWVAFPEPAGAAAAPAAGAEGRGSSAWGEALVTSLVMQYLKLQGTVLGTSTHASLVSWSCLSDINNLLCCPRGRFRCLKPLHHPHATAQYPFMHVHEGA